MKSLIITDMHHEHPQSTIERAIDAGIEKIVSLGDIETPQILNYLLNLKIKKRMIIGDHEYHHCHGMEIHSSSMNHDCEYYLDLWEDSPQEREFVLKYGKIKNKNQGCTKGLKVIDNINGQKVCYVHGSLIEWNPKHPTLNGIMWGRLFNDNSNVEKVRNFESMKKAGYKILFRGHDHCNELYSITNTDSLDIKNITVETNIHGQSRILEKNKLYIVTIGAFKNGECLIFDEDTFKIKFTSTGYLL